jgi:PHD/YefM family antitoxin component YafN of YafNO toxin-antitoxin module
MDICWWACQRCDVEKDKHPILVTSDPRRQVLLIKKKEKEAMEKRQAEENERLRKLNEVIHLLNAGIICRLLV